MRKKVYERTTAVQIVRPDSGALDFVSRIANLALATWVAMLALGALTPWHLGYLHTLLGVYAIRSVLDTSGYVYWTRPRRSVKR